MYHGILVNNTSKKIVKALDIKEESPAEKISAREMLTKFDIPLPDKETQDLNQEINLAGLVPAFTVEEIHALAFEPAQDFSEKIEEQEKSAADIPTPPVRKKKSKST
jgi:hypothetical protein